jgi:hypothetical protein
MKVELTRNTFLASDRTYGASRVCRDLLAGEGKSGRGPLSTVGPIPALIGRPKIQSISALRQRATGASCAQLGEPRPRRIDVNWFE